MIREGLEKILTEPSIAYLDWEIAKVTLGKWKATLPDKIIALLRSEGVEIPSAEDEAARDKIAKSNARGMGLL